MTFIHFKNHPKYACAISPDIATFVKNRGLVCFHWNVKNCSGIRIKTIKINTSMYLRMI